MKLFLHPTSQTNSSILTTGNGDSQNLLKTEEFGRWRKIQRITASLLFPISDYAEPVGKVLCVA